MMMITFVMVSKNKFSVLLILASQRFETFVNEWVGVETEWVSTDVTTKRGAPPTIVEWFILAWVFGKLNFSKYKYF